MDFKVCEYCGKEYDQDELGVDKYGDVYHGEYDTLYCSLKCYKAACKVEGSEAQVQAHKTKLDNQAEKEYAAHKEKINAMKNPSKCYCKKCGDDITGLLNTDGLCISCFDKRNDELKRKAREEKLSNSVEMDGIYLSPDKTTLVTINQNLTTLNVPAGVTKIAKDACKGCKKLITVVLPDGLQEIGGMAFYDSTVESINFPNTLKKIGAEAFAFSGLKSIELPESLVEIGDGAFKVCDNLANVKILNAKKLGKSIFFSSKLKTAELHNANKLSHSMFSECRNLDDLTIPSSISNIEDYALDYCLSLTEVKYFDEGKPSPEIAAKINEIIKENKKRNQRLNPNSSVKSSGSKVASQLTKSLGSAFGDIGKDAMKTADKTIGAFKKVFGEFLKKK